MFGSGTSEPVLIIGNSTVFRHLEMAQFSASPGKGTLEIAKAIENAEDTTKQVSVK